KRIESGAEEKQRANSNPQGLPLSIHRSVLDTNIYIDWLNRGLHEDLVFRLGTVKCLSAIVMMELFAGVDTLHDRRILHRLVITFRKLGRIVTPSEHLYQEAGYVLHTLRTRLHYNVSRDGSLVNDVLIALSARSIRAEVVTQNKRDFLAI